MQTKAIPLGIIAALIGGIVWLAVPPSQPANATPFAEITLNGTTVSATIEATGLCVVGIQMSGTWTAAAINFKCSEERTGAFNDLFDADGNQIAITTDASRYIELTKGGNQICGCTFLQAVSSNSQASARTLFLQLARS